MEVFVYGFPLCFSVSSKHCNCLSSACSGTVRRRCRTAAAPCAGVYVHSWDTAKKRMEALEKTLSEMNETLKEIKEALSSEKNETQ